MWCGAQRIWLPKKKNEAPETTFNTERTNDKKKKQTPKTQGRQKEKAENKNMKGKRLTSTNQVPRQQKIRKFASKIFPRLVERSTLPPASTLQVFIWRTQRAGRKTNISTARKHQNTTRNKNETLINVYKPNRCSNFFLEGAVKLKIDAQC